MIKIFKYLKKNEWIFMLVSFVLIVFQVWLDLKLPDYMAKNYNAPSNGRNDGF